MSTQLRKKLALYLQLVRFDKPVGTLLLLWPTLTALLIATKGNPSILLWLIFTLGTLLMRSAGCAVNDAADRDFDRHVKRTSERVVASGQLSRREALWVATALAALAGLLLIPLNWLSFQLALVALMVAASYPLLKRFFPMPQAYLAIAFSFGIPMAFAAAQNQVPAVAWWLFAANLFWVVAYDTEYAMVDRDDDLKIGVRSSAVLFGRADVVIIMLCYALHLALLLRVAQLAAFTWPFFVAWAIAAALSVYQYVLIKDRERGRCFAAFKQSQWLGFAVFMGTALSYVKVS